MRGVAGFFCGLFGLAAALQWNDPDPFGWIGAYGLAALLAGGKAAGRSWPAANLVAALGFALWFGTLAPSLLAAESAAFREFEMTEARHEEPREAVGLALCSAWCGAVAWIGFTRRDR